METCTLLFLPLDLQKYIFSYLQEVEDISSIRRVCKDLLNLSNSNIQTITASKEGLIKPTLIQALIKLSNVCTKLHVLIRTEEELNSIILHLLLTHVSILVSSNLSLICCVMFFLSKINLRYLDGKKKYRYLFSLPGEKNRVYKLTNGELFTNDHITSALLDLYLQKFPLYQLQTRYDTWL